MRPQLVLIVPMLAHGAALAAPDSERPAATRAAQSATRHAVRGVADAISARRGEVKIVEVMDGVPYMKLDGPLPPYGDLVADADRSAWHGVSAARRVGDVTTGDRVVVTGLDGETSSCRVDGHEVLVRGVSMEGFDLGGDEPGCGLPEAWARLTCDDEPIDGFAVPAGTARPLAYRDTGPASGPAADEALDALWRSNVWQRARADARGMALGEVAENAEVRGWRGPTGLVYSVDAVVYTGEGWTACGSEDFLVHVTGVVDASGRVLVPFREREGMYGPEIGTIEGLLDLDGGGVPAIWTSATGMDGHQALIDGNGVERASVDHPWCGCPC